MSEEAGGAVRFAGKVDVWFYLITIAANILLIVPAAMAFADPAKEGALLGAAISLGCLVVCDALFIPMIARNYVEFDDEGNFVVVFGWQAVRVPVEKVRALRETRSPLASTAASFDRIAIQLGLEETMIAVKDKEAFYRAVEQRCPHATVERRAR